MFRIVVRHLRGSRYLIGGSNNPIGSRVPAGRGIEFATTREAKRYAATEFTEIPIWQAVELVAPEGNTVCVGTRHGNGWHWRD